MSKNILAAGISLVFGYVATLMSTKLSLSIPVSLALAGLTVLSFGWFIAEEIKTFRTRDEMHRRIQLEALAVAFPLSILLVFALGLLERIIPLSADDWSFRHVWPFFIAFYAVGLTIADRRYR